MAWPPSMPIISAVFASRFAVRIEAASVPRRSWSGRRRASSWIISISRYANCAAPRPAYAGGTYAAKNEAVIPLARSEARSVCASGSCSSR